MRLRDQYDWIVLGNHPGALLSASLAARLGLAVLVVPVVPTLGFLVSRSGQAFDPETNYLLGLGKSPKVDGLVYECLTQLGILSSEEEFIQSETSAPQVITPQARLTLTPNENLIFEFQREFGKPFSRQVGLVNALKSTEADYLSFWHSLPKRLTLTSTRKSASVEPLTLSDLRRKLKKNLNQVEASILAWISQRKKISDLSESFGQKDFNEVCQGLWHSVSPGSTSDPALFDLLHLFSLSRTGATFRGGLTSYREFLINLARRLGVHVPIKTDCKRIFIEKGRFTGVQVSNRGNPIVAGAGILGCSLDRALSRITYTGRNWFLRKKKSPQPVGWKFTLALSVHNEAVPSSLLSRAVWQERNAPILEIEVVNPSDYNLADPNHKILQIRTWMPFTVESLKRDYQSMIAGRMIRQVMEIFPFLEFHVTRIYPDFRLKSKGVAAGSLSHLAKKSSGPSSDESAATAASTESEDSAPSDDELSEVYGYSSLDAVPDNLLIYRDKGIGSTSGIDGLFVASDESYPSLGSLGPSVAAIEAVASLAHRSGLAGPFV